jgi:hypothetical protein
MSVAGFRPSSRQLVDALVGRLFPRFCSRTLSGCAFPQAEACGYESFLGWYPANGQHNL